MLYILLAVFCFIVATANGSTEPVCSKFDYEVKLLEKMVRLEFQVSRMLDEIKEASKSNLDKIEALSKSVDEVSQSTTERMNNLSKSLSLDIRDLKQDVEFVYQSKFKTFDKAFLADICTYRYKSSDMAIVLQTNR